MYKLGQVRMIRYTSQQRFKKLRRASDQKVQANDASPHETLKQGESVSRATKLSAPCKTIEHTYQ